MLMVLFCLLNNKANFLIIIEIIHIHMGKLENVKKNKENKNGM